MNKMTHPHSDTREHLLATGQELSLRLGFNGMGLTELLKKAEVPKGSFYHHFRSKEAFGEAMIQRYYESYDAHLLKIFTQTQGDQRQHILSYYAQTITNFCGSEFHNACLAVKLSAEVSDLSEPMRHALEQGTTQVIGRLKDAVEKGIAEESLWVPFSPAATASMLYSMWLGASLLAKIKRSVTPLTTALETIEIFLQIPDKS